MWYLRYYPNTTHFLCACTFNYHKPTKFDCLNLSLSWDTNKSIYKLIHNKRVVEMISIMTTWIKHLGLREAYLFLHMMFSMMHSIGWEFSIHFEPFLDISQPWENMLILNMWGFTNIFLEILSFLFHKNRNSYENMSFFFLTLFFSMENLLYQIKHHKNICYYCIVGAIPILSFLFHKNRNSYENMSFFLLLRLFFPLRIFYIR